MPRQSTDNNADLQRPVLDYSTERAPAIWPVVFAYTIGTLAVLSAPFMFITVIELASVLSSAERHTHGVGAGLSFIFWSVFPAWWLARRVWAGRSDSYRAFVPSRPGRSGQPGA